LTIIFKQGSVIGSVQGLCSTNWRLVMSNETSSSSLSRTRSLEEDEPEQSTSSGIKRSYGGRKLKLANCSSGLECSNSFHVDVDVFAEECEITIANFQQAIKGEVSKNWIRGKEMRAMLIVFSRLFLGHLQVRLIQQMLLSLSRSELSSTPCMEPVMEDNLPDWFGTILTDSIHSRSKQRILVDETLRLQCL
jgi:hypothetical protein